MPRLRRLAAVAVAAASTVAGLLVPIEANAAEAPAIFSLGVETHVLENQVIGHVIDWSVSDSWADGNITLTFEDESFDVVEQVTLPTIGATSGSTRVDWLPRGVTHAAVVKVNDGAGHTTSYSLEMGDSLLDDVWFATFVDAPDVPVAPTIADLVPGPDAGEIAVLCSRVDGNGLPILEYSLTAVPMEGGETVVRSRRGPSGCSNVISGLVPGRPYSIAATARTGAGTSRESLAAWTIAGANAPEAPTGLTSTVGDQSVRLQWTQPFSGGEQLRAYAVEIRNSAGRVVEDGVLAHEWGDADTYLDVSELQNGDSYDFRVQAYTNRGWGDWSQWSDPFVPTSGVVPTHTTVTASWAAPGVLSVTWEEPYTGPSDPVLEFEIRLDTPEGLITVSNLRCCSWTSESEFDSTQSHGVEVRARNSAGWSEWSQITDATGIDKPDQLGELAVWGGWRSALASWTEPAATATSFGYLLTPGRVAGAGPGEVTESTTGSFERLSPGQDYVVSVWGLNDLGEPGPTASVLLRGTEIVIREPVSTPVAGQAVTVRGRTLTTFADRGLVGRTVVLQRKRADARGFRTLDPSAVTTAHGRFAISYLPRAGISYRVALLGESGLGGSAAPLLVAS